MDTPNSIAYSTKVTAVGGRDGAARSEDGKLTVALSTPQELGGAGGDGTNPEQLFAAGYSACFLGAMKLVATQEKITLTDDLSITGTVGVGPIDGGFAITVSLDILVPGMERTEALSLIGKAHQVCPYSNATRGNVDVRLNLV